MSCLELCASSHCVSTGAAAGHAPTSTQLLHSPRCCDATMRAEGCLPMLPQVRLSFRKVWTFVELILALGEKWKKCGIR